MSWGMWLCAPPPACLARLLDVVVFPRVGRATLVVPRPGSPALGDSAQFQAPGDLGHGARLDGPSGVPNVDTMPVVHPVVRDGTDSSGVCICLSILSFPVAQWTGRRHPQGAGDAAPAPQALFRVNTATTPLAGTSWGHGTFVIGDALVDAYGGRWRAPWRSVTRLAAPWRRCQRCRCWAACRCRGGCASVCGASRT